MQLNSLEDIQKISTDDVIIVGLKQLRLSPNKIFLIIRNLSYPVDRVKIDFSGVDVDEWVESYLKSDIKVEVQDFLDQVVKRICAFIDCSHGVDYSQYPRFICRNSKLLDKICNFCMSSIYYSLQLQTNTPQKFVETINDPLPVNSVFILNHLKDFEAKLCSMKCNIKFYSNEFNEENIIIFSQLLKKSLFGIMLYGSTTPEWTRFVSLTNALYQVNY